MAHNLTDVDTFTSAVTVPDGGDDRTAASVEIPFQALANRTRNTKNRLDNLGVTGPIFVSHAVGIAATTGAVRAATDFEYCQASGAPSPKSKVIMLPLADMMPWNNSWTGAGNILQATGGGLSSFDIPLPVVTGARVTLVRVGCRKTSTAAGLINISVNRKVADKATGAVGPTNVEATVSSTASDTVQIVSTGVFSSSIVNRATEVWYVTVDAAESGDEVYWIEVTISDPGPRNF